MAHLGITLYLFCEISPVVGKALVHTIYTVSQGHNDKNLEEHSRIRKRKNKKQCCLGQF